MQRIGEIIKELIQTSKYSVKEISEKMGVSSPNMYRLFERDSVETKYLVQLSEIFGISITYFFGGKSSSEHEKEIEMIKAELESKDEKINQLQNQIIILEKLVKTNETIIQKQETINELVKLYGVTPINSIDPSDPSFEKLYELAKVSKASSTAFEIFLQMESDPELKKSYFELLDKQKK